MNTRVENPGHEGPAAAATVSVIMPVFNAEPYLRRSVGSVLAQTHRELELIMVDDGSTDGSWALAESYAQSDARVRPIRMLANGGVAAARNAGLHAANGSFVAFLDSDDWWHPHKLALQLECMTTTGARVCYTSYDRYDEDEVLLSQVRPPGEVTYADMLRSNHIGHSTGMYEHELGKTGFLEIGHEDYAFWLDRVRKAGNAVCASADIPLVGYTVRDSSVSSNKLRAAGWQWRIYREVEGFGPIVSAGYMVQYVLNALRKRR